MPRIGELSPNVPEEEARQTMSRLALSTQMRSAFVGLASSLGFGNSVPSNDGITSPASSLSSSMSAARHWEMSRELEEIDWYGEVKDLRLDGVVEVMLPSGRIVEVELGKLSILNDEADPHAMDDGASVGTDGQPLEEDDGEWEDVAGDDDLRAGTEGEEDYVEEKDDWEVEDEEENGREGSMDVEEVGSEGVGSEEGGLKRKRANTNPDSAAVPSVSSSAASLSSATHSTEEVSLSKAPEHTGGVTVTALDESVATLPITVATTTSSTSSTPTSVPSTATSRPRTKPKPDDPSWERFAVLDDAPEDHHFYSEPVGKPNSAFFSRLQKEFKVLASSLPGKDFLSPLFSSLPTSNNS